MPHILIMMQQWWMEWIFMVMYWASAWPGWCWALGVGIALLQAEGTHPIHLTWALWSLVDGKPLWSQWMCQRPLIHSVSLSLVNYVTSSVDGEWFISWWRAMSNKQLMALPMFGLVLWGFMGLFLAKCNVGSWGPEFGWGLPGSLHPNSWWMPYW